MKNTKLVNALAKKVLISVLIAGTVQPVFAQTQAKRKLTVGEMLKRAKEDSRGGKAKILQKGDTVVPDAQFAFQPNQPNVNLSDVKPPKSSELLRNDTSDQGEYEKTLDSQITELFKLTQKFKNSSNRGELWLRLAELYVEKASLVDARRQDEYDAKLKAFDAKKTRLKPKLDTAEAREYNKKAIQLYEWFVRDYPKDSKVSQALFFLGYNYFELNDPKNGSMFYTRLTTEFPTSPFVGEAHFALGEYYFENEKWADAYKEYAKLIKDRKHRLNTFSLYKSAWCLYRMGKTEQAIQYMDFIVKSGSAQSEQQMVGGRKLNSSKLENEALRDLVVFFTELGDTKRAVNYFQSVNGKDTRSYIEKLAYSFGIKGNREASKDVFKLLIKQEPTAKKAFEYQYQIVQNYFYSKNSPQFKEELYRWITDYGPKSTWYAANQADTALIQNAVKLREQTLRNYVMQQHQTAQNSKAAYSRQLAGDGYKLYFQEFADTPQAPDMHFLYGELLYDMNKFDEASTQYSWVSDNAPTSKYGAKASQNLLLAIEKSLPPDEELQKRTGDSVEPIAMDPRVEKFIKAATAYTQRFPKSDKDAEIKFRIGRLYYQTNNFAPAETFFKEIVKTHPKTKYSEYSANLLLDIYNLKKDYAGLEKMGTELLANDSISSSKAGSDIRGVLEKASFKKAQDLELDKKYLESATQFQTFAKQNPKSELASMATFNAAVNFERASHNGDAIHNYRKIMASNDKSSEQFKPKAKKLLAKLYQDAGLLEESAKLFKELAKDNPKDPLRANYIYNTAVMYEALGRTTDAVAAYTEFVSVNKNQRENANTLFNLAQIQRKSGASTAALHRYKEIAEDPATPFDRKVESLYWVYDIGTKLGRHKDPTEAKYELLKVQGRALRDKKSGNASFIAKVRFPDVEKTYASLKAVSIPANPAKQKAAVDKKLDILAKLTSELSEIIKLDSPDEIVSSLNLLGEANDHMVKSILNTPIPENLKEEQRKQYRAGLEQITDKFSKKATESFKLAVDRAWDLEVYTPSYKNALAEMNRRDPKNYYNKGEIGAESRLLNWMGDK
ncbi:MAG: tetratricopeptide repeat protein [Bdellovibrio sp.]|nr:tetratricopeptide repeat protein [Bdellovibrio sp.]